MTKVNFAKAKRMLLQDEGLRRVCYDCGTGKPLFAPVGHTTLGIGHNLDAHPLSNEVIDLLLKEDIERAEREAAAVIDAEIYETLSENRKLGLINLAFNLGEAGLRDFDRMNRRPYDYLIGRKWKKSYGQACGQSRSTQN
jgi:GH24 family phage-related lysozyme (muramidase)